MKHVLRYKHHDIELSEGKFVIGRAASCQLSLDDPLVSRHHAQLTVEGDVVTVEDLGSRNGVKVNGEPSDAVVLPSFCRVAAMNTRGVIAFWSMRRDGEPAQK